MATKVIMPQLGESVVEGTVTKWLRQEGEKIEEFDSLLEVNTDKVDTEIPSPASGTVLKILVAEGETVEAGTLLAWIGQPGEDYEQGVRGDGEQTQATPVGEKPPASQDHAAATQPVATSAAPADQPSLQEKPDEAQAAQGPVQEQEPPEHPQVPAEPPAREEPAPAATVQSFGGRRELGFISPVVARMAEEHGVDLYQVEGTGEGGRITKRDVQDYLDRQHERRTELQPEPEPEPGAPAPWETPGEGDLFRPTELMFPGEQEEEKEEEQPQQPAARQEPQAEAPAAVQPGELISLSPMRQRIAEHMVHSKHTSPHVTTVMEANLAKVTAHREANKARYAQNGVNLTYTAYFVSAAVEALKAYPLVNSSWTDGGIRVHGEIHIGLAVSLGEEGLIVPVIKGADGYSLLGLARAVNDLAQRARSKGLKPDDVRGGTFSITNHGTGRSLFATPIINQPQTGILGVGAIQKRVVVIEDAIAIRPMVYLSLTFDHRILDGGAADGFLWKVVTVLEEWS
jgi:pyruvate/2-oxoglutarate dehydrogenase complex dihydrolipoamide acyltransferase (E2) component